MIDDLIEAAVDVAAEIVEAVITSNKKRLDTLVRERGLAESRERAKTLVTEGNIYVSGKLADKPGARVSASAHIEVRGAALKFVSRGGYKLERALEYFGIDITGRVCADIGASTGGFTDCLLQSGAAKVFAVDAGHDQLAHSLRDDPRVVVMESRNARHLTAGALGETVSFVCVDVSFISLAHILPAVRRVLKIDGDAVCLIKPQFEAGRGKVGKNGVVRDIGTHIEVLEAFIGASRENGLGVAGLTHSPIKGPEGNIEFLARLIGAAGMEIDIRAAVLKAHEELN